ncbi:MAG: 30S ribosomal protein S6 [Oscillospiraceae bacterium]|nr:30S ribosomal protein S6 [Oscillospiraceae bacterium]
MAKLTANYETVMIFNVQTGEEGIAALSEKFKSLISANGTITNVEDWGKRRLAYPIEDETEGYYLFVEFTSAPEFPAELDRIYKITDGVLRSMIVNKVEA